MPGLEFMGQGVRRIRCLQAREALVVPEWPLASILGQYASDSEDDNADAGSAAAADGDGCDDDDAAAELECMPALVPVNDDADIDEDHDDGSGDEDVAIEAGIYIYMSTPVVSFIHTDKVDSMRTHMSTTVHLYTSILI